MKIIVRNQEQNLNLTLPTNLIFSKFVLKLVLKNVCHISKIDQLPHQAIDALVDELCRIKKRCGSWELVQVDSAGGEHVEIIL